MSNHLLARIVGWAVGALLLCIALVALSGCVPTGQVPAHALQRNILVMSDYGQGSGVVVSQEHKLVLTAKHVVEDKDFVFLTLPNGEKAEAAVIWKEKDKDIALLMVRGDAPLPPAASFRTLTVPSVGSPVVLVSNPLGIHGVVTKGSVAKIEKDEIRLDITAGPGSSGGGAYDKDGLLIGILLSGVVWRADFYSPAVPIGITNIISIKAICNSHLSEFLVDECV